MLEMLAKGPRHPLRDLRETAGVTQAELAQVTGLSCTRISLAENFLGHPLTESEEKKLKDAVLSITEERRLAVLSGARGNRR